MNNSKDSEGPPPRTPVSPFVLASPRASDAELFSIRPLANFHGNQEVNEDEDTNVAEVARYNPIETSQNAEDPTPGFRRMATSLPNIAFYRWPEAVQEDPDEMAQTEADVRPAKTTLTEEVDPRVNDPEFTDEPACNSLNAEALPSPMEPIHSGLRSRQNQMFVMVAPNEVPMDCLFDVVLAEVSDYERWIMCYALPLGLYTTRVDGSPPRWRILEHWPNVDEVALEHKMRQYKLKKPPVPTVAIDRFAFHQFIVSRQQAPVRGGENSEEAPPATDSEMARQLEREFGLNGASRLIPMNLGGHFPAYLRLSPGQPAHRLAQNSSHASSANSNRSNSAAKATSVTRLNRQRSQTQGRPGRQQQAQHSHPVPNSFTSAEARPVHQSQLYPRQPTSQPSYSRQDASLVKHAMEAVEPARRSHHDNRCASARKVHVQTQSRTLTEPEFLRTQFNAPWIGHVSLSRHLLKSTRDALSLQIRVLTQTKTATVAELLHREHSHLKPPRGMDNRYRPKRISADSGFDAYEEWAS